MLKQFDRKAANRGATAGAVSPRSPSPGATAEFSIGHVIPPGKAGPTRTICTLKDLNQC